jgi:hypothetical protein
MHFSVGNIFTIIPNPEKWVLFPFYGFILCTIFLNYWFWLRISIAHEKKPSNSSFSLKNSLIQNSLSFGKLSFILILEIIVPCFIAKNYFVAMLLFPIEFVLFIFVIITNFCYKRNTDFIIPILIVTIFSAIFLSTLSPIFELWRLQY